VVAESPGCWLLAGTELGPKGHKAGGWGGSQREALFAENWSFSLQDSLGWQFCAGLVTGSQPATHKQGE